MRLRTINSMLIYVNLFIATELEERARLLKQRLNTKQSNNTTPVPFSDSEVTGHRSRPRDGRKVPSRGSSGDNGRIELAQRDLNYRLSQTTDRRYSTRLRDELMYKRGDPAHRRQGEHKTTKVC